jgi:SnoaL-like domain
VRDSADITSITQLILRERESRDMQRWKTMPDCFWPDSIVRVRWFRGSGPDFVTGSIEMSKQGIPAKHGLGPVLVRLKGDREVASLAGIIDLPVKLKGV